MNEEEKKGMVWLWVGGAYALSSLVGLILLFFPSKVFGVDWNWGLAILLSIVMYTIASLQSLSPIELGARVLFGRPVDNVSSGLVFVPFGIFTLERGPATYVHDELPDDSKNIFRGEGPVPPGMTLPAIIQFGPPAINVSGCSTDGISLDDPLNAQMAAEVVVAITWKIQNFAQFLTGVGGVSEARRQIADTAIAMATRSFAKMTPAAVLKNLGHHNDALMASIEAKTEDWGVEIIAVGITAINLDRRLEVAMEGVPIARAIARATVITATGERTRIILVGEGAGAAERAVLEGRTAGLKKMSDELGLTGREVLGAETARGITGNPGNKTIIVGADGFPMLSAIAGTVLEETKKS